MEVQELADREAIRDAIQRYAQGIDRLDMALVLSAYHPGALDDHGYFKGPAEEFAEFLASPEVLPALEATTHAMGCTSIDLDGDVAHTETYCIGHHVSAPPHPWGSAYVVMGMRYVDRFERRDGKWAIAERTCVYDWTQRSDDQPQELPSENVRGRRDRGDISYARSE